MRYHSIFSSSLSLSKVLLFLSVVIAQFQQEVTPMQHYISTNISVPSVLQALEHHRQVGHSPLLRSRQNSRGET